MVSITHPIPLENVLMVYKEYVKGCQGCKYIFESQDSIHCKDCTEMIIGKIIRKVVE